MSSAKTVSGKYYLPYECGGGTRGGFCFTINVSLGVLWHANRSTIDLGQFEAISI